MAKGGRLVMDKAIISGNPSLNEIVYCYQFPSRRDRIKIGYSSRGLKRILEQSTGFPENPEVLFVIHHPKAKQIEPDLHARLSHKQAKVLGVEWFNANIRDVLAVSPLLRKAARKQRWKSVPRLFAGGALFGLGLFFMPLIALGLLQLTGKAHGVSSMAVMQDYLKSPFVDSINTLELAKLMMEHFWTVSDAWWLSTAVIASPILWIGLAYFSFRKQVA